MNSTSAVIAELGCVERLLRAERAAHAETRNALATSMANLAEARRSVAAMAVSPPPPPVQLNFKMSKAKSEAQGERAAAATTAINRADSAAIATALAAELSGMERVIETLASEKRAAEAMLQRALKREVDLETELDVARAKVNGELPAVRAELKGRSAALEALREKAAQLEKQLQTAQLQHQQQQQVDSSSHDAIVAAAVEQANRAAEEHLATAQRAQKAAENAQAAGTAHASEAEALRVAQAELSATVRRQAEELAQMRRELLHSEEASKHLLHDASQLVERMTAAEARVATAEAQAAQEAARAAHEAAARNEAECARVAEAEARSKAEQAEAEARAMAEQAAAQASVQAAASLPPPIAPPPPPPAIPLPPPAVAKPVGASSVLSSASFAQSIADAARARSSRDPGHVTAPQLPPSGGAVHPLGGVGSLASLVAAAASARSSRAASVAVDATVRTTSPDGEGEVPSAAVSSEAAAPPAPDLPEPTASLLGLAVPKLTLPSSPSVGVDPAPTAGRKLTGELSARDAAAAARDAAAEARAGSSPTQQATAHILMSPRVQIQLNRSAATATATATAAAATVPTAFRIPLAQPRAEITIGSAAAMSECVTARETAIKPFDGSRSHDDRKEQETHRGPSGDPGRVGSAQLGAAKPSRLPPGVSPMADLNNRPSFGTPDAASSATRALAFSGPRSGAVSSPLVSAEASSPVEVSPTGTIESTAAMPEQTAEAGEERRTTSDRLSRHTLARPSGKPLNIVTEVLAHDEAATTRAAEAVAEKREGSSASKPRPKKATAPRGADKENTPPAPMSSLHGAGGGAGVVLPGVQRARAGKISQRKKGSSPSRDSVREHIGVLPMPTPCDRAAPSARSDAPSMNSRGQGGGLAFSIFEDVEDGPIRERGGGTVSAEDLAAAAASGKENGRPRSSPTRRSGAKSSVTLNLDSARDKLTTPGGTLGPLSSRSNSGCVSGRVTTARSGKSGFESGRSGVSTPTVARELRNVGGTVVKKARPMRSSPHVEQLTVPAVGTKLFRF